MGKHPKIWRPARVNIALHETCVKYGIGERDIISHSRKHLQARREVWWRVRQMLNIHGKPYSYPQIAMWFDREHTSVMDGVKKHAVDLVLQAEAKAAREQVFPCS